MLHPHQPDGVGEEGVVVGVGEQVVLVDLVAQEVDGAGAAHAEELEAAQLGTAQVHLEGEVLVVGDRAGARGGHAGDAVAVAHQVTGTVLPAERPLGHELQAAEGAYLRGELMLVAVAGAEVHVEHRSIGVAIFGRKGAGEEVAGAEQVGVQGAHRPSSGAQRAEVVGGADGQALHPPEQAGGRVAAHHDVVARVVGPAHPGEVGGQAGHIVAPARVARHLLQAEGAGAHLGQFVVRAVLAGGVSHLELLQLFHGALQGDVQHHLLAGGHQHIGDGERLVADEGDGQLLAAHRHALQPEEAVEVGGGA